MELSFEKYHGLGNDFIVVDNRDHKVKTDLNIDSLAKQIAVLCERESHTSIGADGVIFIEHIQEGSSADIRYRIFNADGYEARICGNGLRCFAKYCIEHKIVTNSIMKVETGVGILECEILENGLIRTEIGKATTKISEIPAISHENKSEIINQSLEIAENESHHVTFVGTGNPHCVIYVEGDLSNVDVSRIGKLIQAKSDVLPESANIEFVSVVDEKHIRLRVYERGCGETQACGTGACAAVVSGIINKKNSNQVKVSLAGGDLFVSVKLEDMSLQIIGPAVKVFSGSVQVHL